MPQCADLTRLKLNGNDVHKHRAVLDKLIIIYEGNTGLNVQNPS